MTEPWGVKVEQVQMKNVEIPTSMQRAMAQEAEALREKRARQIKAEAELEAAKLLRAAAETIMVNPAGLELRRMQMITEVGAEQNTMTIIMMPSEFVDMARALRAENVTDSLRTTSDISLDGACGCVIGKLESTSRRIERVETRS